MNNFINLTLSILVLSIFVPVEIIGLVLLITVPCALLSELFITLLTHSNVVLLFLGFISIYIFYIFIEVAKFEYKK